MPCFGFGGIVTREHRGVLLGPELVTNGDFASGVGWTLDAANSVSGGVLNVIALSGADAALRAVAFTAGRVVEVELVIATVTAAGAGVTVTVGGTAGPTYTTTGTKRFRITAGAGDGNLAITLVGLLGFVGTIDSVSCREVR